MNKLTIILTAIVLTLACHSAPAATFFVATDGNDANPGTETKPFATLQRARHAARELKRTAPTPQSTNVVVRGGTYHIAASLTFDAQDSGTETAPAVWQTATGEEVRLCGGAILPADAFRPVEDIDVRARLDTNSPDKVLQTDLRALGIDELGDYPDRFRGAPAVPELFFNDQRLAVACWPNQGWTTIAKIIDSGSIPRVGDNSNRPGVFEYEGDRPARWNVDAGI